MINIQLHENAAKLLVDFLGELSEIFGNNGCNDLNSKQEKLLEPLKEDIAKTMKMKKEDVEYLGDFQVVDYLQQLVKDSIKDRNI